MKNVKIYKNLYPISAKELLKSLYWMDRNYCSLHIFQPNLQELAIDENLSMSLKLKIEQKCLPYDCVDNNSFIAIYEEFKFFKGNAKLNRLRKKISFQMFFD